MKLPLATRISFGIYDMVHTASLVFFNTVTAAFIGLFVYAAIIKLIIQPIQG